MGPTIVIDKQKYLTPSWNDTGQICFDLAQQIIAKKYQFDRLVALVKGGLTWSRTLLDYLNIQNLSAFQVKFYENIGKTSKKPIIVQSLPVVVENETIILFDDVTDSGETLKLAKEYLLTCGAKKVITSSLFLKDWAKFKPDFYAQKTNAWIIFPHEIRETINFLSNSWRKKGIKPNLIQTRLISLGIPVNQIRYLLKIK